jgi:tetratricopeptide (TPR) repeat protein
MQVAWYVRLGAQEHGPITAEQLKALAQTGRLKPQDWVRQGEAGTWTPAKQVGGLFAPLPSGSPLKARPAEQSAVPNAHGLPPAHRPAQQPTHVAQALPISSAMPISAALSPSIPTAAPIAQVAAAPSPMATSVPVAAPVVAASAPVAVRSAATNRNRLILALATVLVLSAVGVVGVAYFGPGQTAEIASAETASSNASAVPPPAPPETAPAEPSAPQVTAAVTTSPKKEEPKVDLTAAEQATVSLEITIGEMRRTASGFVADASGEVATSFDAIAGAETIAVSYANGHRTTISGITRSLADVGLCLLQPMDPPSDIQPLAPTRMTVRSGMRLWACGHNPDGAASNVTLTLARIQTGQELMDSLPDDGKAPNYNPQSHWFQLSGSVPATHLGAPLVDDTGVLAGVCVRSGDNGTALATAMRSMGALLREKPSLQSLVANTPPVPAGPNSPPMPAPVAASPAKPAMVAERTPAPPPPPSSPATDDTADATDPLAKRIAERRESFRKLEEARGELVVENQKATAVATDLKTKLDAAIALFQSLAKEAAMIQRQIADLEAANNDMRASLSDSKVTNKAQLQAAINQNIRTQQKLSQEYNKLDQEARKVNAAGQVLNQEYMSAQAQLAALGERAGRLWSDWMTQLDPFGKFSRQEQEAMLTIADRLLQADSRNGGALLMRGLVIARAGEPDVALDSLNQAVALGEPYLVPALAARGRVYFVLGKEKEGLADFAQAMKVNKKSGLAYLMRGEGYLALGKFPLADKDFKTAIQLGEDLEGNRLLALHYAASSALGKHDAKRALDCAKRASESGGTSDWRCLDALAAAYAEDGQFDEAVKVANQAADLALGTNRDLCLARAKQYEAKQPLRIEWK